MAEPAHGFLQAFHFPHLRSAFAELDLEGLRLLQIITAIERLGVQVVRAPRIEDAELAVQTDAAIGCMVVDWGKKGVEGKTATLINLMRRRGLEMPIVMLVRRKQFEDIPSRCSTILMAISSSPKRRRSLLRKTS